MHKFFSVFRLELFSKPAMLKQSRNFPRKTIILASYFLVLLTACAFKQIDGTRLIDLLIVSVIWSVYLTCSLLPYSSINCFFLFCPSFVFYTHLVCHVRPARHFILPAFSRLYSSCPSCPFCLSCPSCSPFLFCHRCPSFLFYIRLSRSVRLARLDRHRVSAFEILKLPLESLEIRELKKRLLSPFFIFFFMLCFFFLLLHLIQ